ncbi:hypothetical protein EW026_g1820 [Hermanssonia centrifuga]|uniref:DUF6533 domain-containing protein n=1 Tax=Hermanssonia centrifuga TaxID=98765 RepID=A0A4S4KUQ3_9APHY|nr:hypothetical protein EW026_g1820 [Hermanssonia centrifuga]
MNTLLTSTAKNETLSSLTAIADNRFVNSMWYMTYAILLYDYSLTFSDEVALVWGGKTSYARMLFYVIRYWPLLNLTIVTGGEHSELGIGIDTAKKRN